MTVQTSGIGSTGAIQSSTDIGPTGSIQLMFAKLQLAQSQLCKETAEAHMKEIQDIQKEQKETADMISRARTLQNEAKSKGESVASEMPADMKKFFNDRGLTIDDKGKDSLHNEKEWDINIKSLTNHQEQIGTKTQTLMVYLQDAMGQYNSYLQGANSAISKASDTLTSILR